MERLAAFPPFVPGQRSIPAAQLNAIQDIAQRLQRGGSVSPGEPQAVIKLKEAIIVNALGLVVQVFWDITASPPAWVETGRQFSARNTGPVNAGDGAITILTYADDREPAFFWAGASGGTGGAAYSLSYTSDVLAADTYVVGAFTDVAQVTTPGSGLTAVFAYGCLDLSPNASAAMRLLKTGTPDVELTGVVQIVQNGAALFALVTGGTPVRLQMIADGNMGSNAVAGRTCLLAVNLALLAS